jgi:hypothetical protein
MTKFKVFAKTQLVTAARSVNYASRLPRLSLCSVVLRSLESNFLFWLCVVVVAGIKRARGEGRL